MSKQAGSLGARLKALEENQRLARETELHNRTEEERQKLIARW